MKKKEKAKEYLLVLQLVYIAYFGISYLIKTLSLYVSKLQQKKMFSPWEEDTDPLISRSMSMEWALIKLCI